MLSFSFWNELKNADKLKYPAIVKKHGLTVSDLERVSSILREGKLESEWLDGLYKECIGCGLINADAVFIKYGIDEEMKDVIVKKWFAQR